MPRRLTLRQGFFPISRPLSTEGGLFMSGLTLTRRDFLKNAGQASLTLAATQATSPFVFSEDRAQEANAITVGILHSLSGIMANFEVPLWDAAMMALDEINASGGVLGR